jgi:N-acetylneuraminic acid mutarotase
VCGCPNAVIFKKKVYIGGGGGAPSEREEQTVIIYDPEQDSYDTLPPYTCELFSMVVINNQLVLVGGVDAQTCKVTNKLGVWNEQSETWTPHPLPPMTTECYSPSVATHDDRWLVVIGCNRNEFLCLSRVEILDTTESRQWYHAASLPQLLTSALPAVIGNMCYLLGGYNSRHTPSRKVFSVCLDDLISEAVSQSASASAPPTPSPWQSLPDAPLEQSTGLAFRGGLLAVGGRPMPMTFSTTLIHHYQPSSRSWAKMDNGELPSRHGCTCAVLPSGDLFIAGGFRAEQRVDIVLVE